MLVAGWVGFSPDLGATEIMRRLRMPPGSERVIFKDSITQGNTVYYSVNAVAGQKLVVRVASEKGDVVFGLMGPDDSVLAENTKRLSRRLPRSGYYRIALSPTGRGAEYQMMVKIK